MTADLRLGLADRRDDRDCPLALIPLYVSKIFKFGEQRTSIGLGKYYPVSPEGAPTLGLEATVTLLFPTGRFDPGETIRWRGQQRPQESIFLPL